MRMEATGPNFVNFKMGTMRCSNTSLKSGVQVMGCLVVNCVTLGSR